MTQPKTAAAWRKMVADLKGRHHEAEAQARELDDSRGGFVLAAMTGDEAAKAKLAQYDARIAEAQQEARDLARAIEAAEAELAEAERREADERRQKDREEAEKLEAHAARAAQRVDGGLARVAHDVGEVERLLSRAARLRGRRGAGAVPSRIENALRSAYWHSGMKVGDYVPAGHRGTFAERLGALLGLGPSADEHPEEAPHASGLK